MIKLTRLYIGIALLFIFACQHSNKMENYTSEIVLTNLSTIAQAYTNHESNIEVCQTGKIIALLHDDTIGLRHQRFIVELANHQTLMIIQNIDIAPRIPNPKIGKELSFYGEYEWNQHGGVVHWTHKDSGGKHLNGWIEYNGIRYE